MTVAASNEECMSCPPSDNTREVSSEAVLHPGAGIGFQWSVDEGPHLQPV